MAKFIYRMQNILNLRTKLEEEAKARLAMANNALNIEQEKLKAIYRDIDSYQWEIRGYSNSFLDVLELKRCNDAIAVKKLEAEAQRLNIAKAKKNVEAAMQRLREAMIERKTQETLKDKAFEAFKQEVNYEELKEIDQVVSYQYNGKREEGEA